MKGIKKTLKDLIPQMIMDFAKMPWQIHNSLHEIQTSLDQIHDRILYETALQQTKESKNPLNKAGAKYFSQTDEDGITLEILKRLNLRSGTFAEFGVGDGSENNTLILIAQKWKGFWIGGQSLCFNPGEALKNFYFSRTWVNRDNIVDSTKQCLERIGSETVDLISLDLDGNDIYFVEALLENKFLPKVFIVEYNALFPPPIEFQIEYNSSHVWKGDDYFGASLTSFVNLFRRYEFSLVCCNAHTGANAFFVKNDFMDRFSDIPEDIRQLFCGPRYQLYKRFAHAQSPKTIEKLLCDNE